MGYHIIIHICGFSLRGKSRLFHLPSELEDQPSIFRSLTPEFNAMANKSLREFSAPNTDNIRTGPAVDFEKSFELKPVLINMAQASQFYGKAHEDASAHLQHFLEIYNTFTIKDVPTPQRCHPTSPLPILTLRESEAVVLCN
jgi:hypothetical protein